MSVIELAPPNIIDLPDQAAAFREVQIGALLAAEAIRSATELEPTDLSTAQVELGEGIDWQRVITGVPQQATVRSEWWRPAPMNVPEATVLLNLIGRRLELARANVLASVELFKGTPVTVSPLSKIMADAITRQAFNNDPNVAPDVVHDRRVSGELLGLSWDLDKVTARPMLIVAGPDKVGVLTISSIPLLDDSGRVAVSAREFDSIND